MEEGYSLDNNTLISQNDESLMECLWQYNQQAFTILVERHTQKFYASAYRMVLNKQEAEDIVQEGFLKIWNNPKLWKKDKGAKFTTWFYRIIMNLCLDYLRKGSRVGYVEDFDAIEDDTVSQEKTLVDKEQQKMLNSAIATLPEKQRMALTLCFYEGLSNKEAAGIVGVKVKALESLLMRAKAGVRDCLAREGILIKGEAA